MKKSLITTLFLTSLAGGCFTSNYPYDGPYSPPQNQSTQFARTRPASQGIQTAQSAQPSHEDMKRWYLGRFQKSPKRNLEGSVKVLSEFSAAVMDEATFSPPELKPGDLYPTYEFFPGDRIGFFCFSRGKEVKTVSLVLRSPQNQVVIRKDYQINEDDQTVGSTYEVSKLMAVHEQGEYQGEWFFDGNYVCTSLAFLKK